jgi:quinolinate synthase
VAVVNALGTERVIFLPDEYLGRHVASHVRAEVILWQGHCEVHERFTAADVRLYRAQHSDLQVLAHPECPPGVLAEADYVGSTSGMIRHVSETRPQRALLLTECSMSDNVSVQFPEVEFVRPCNLCPHMKRITLPGILHSLRSLEHRVEVDREVAERARRAVQKMLEIMPGTERR